MGCDCGGLCQGGVDVNDHVLPALYNLGRQTELLAELVGVLAPGVHNVSQQATEDGTGRATIVLPIQPGGQSLVWRIERWTQSVLTGGSLTSTGFGLYVMDAAPNKVVGVTLDDLYLRDATSIMPRAVADQTNPIQGVGAQTVLAQWTGLPGSAICKFSMQYNVAWRGTD